MSYFGGTQWGDVCTIIRLHLKFVWVEVYDLKGRGEYKTIVCETPALCELAIAITYGLLLLRSYTT